MALVVGGDHVVTLDGGVASLTHGLGTVFLGLALGFVDVVEYVDRCADGGILHATVHGLHGTHHATRDVYHLSLTCQSQAA